MGANSSTEHSIVGSAPESKCRPQCMNSDGSWPMPRPRVFPLLIEDTTDADNQMALAGYVQTALSMTKLQMVDHALGIFGVVHRHCDLSFPLAFAKDIVKNRPDFRAFEPSKNAHEGTAVQCLADKLAGLTEADVNGDVDLVCFCEIHRTYMCIMKVIGFDPAKKESWDYIQRVFPSRKLPLCKEHLLSHHYFAREFLFHRGDLDGNSLGDPLGPKSYSKKIGEIDGTVAAKEDGSYDRDEDVKKGYAAARRLRARKIIQEGLDAWDKILGKDHKQWVNECHQMSENLIGEVTDVVIMAPCTLSRNDWHNLRNCKRVWGMFFALDNAAEYGHWVMEEKAKNIFRNNFNTALDEDGTNLMLEFIRSQEVRAYFHPTELFKGEVGQKSWEIAKIAVDVAKETINNGDLDVPPLLAVYNSYNFAKSPNGDAQQVSDPMIVFELLTFMQNMRIRDKADRAANNDDDQSGDSSRMPVAAYSPAIVQEDKSATHQNHDAAVAAARAKGIPQDRIDKLVRTEKVFVVQPTYEPLNNGTYVGMNLVNRMVGEYSKWLHELLTSKPNLTTPKEMCEVLPIMDVSLKVALSGGNSRPWGCGN